jgi:hypothetical protein
MFFVKVSQNKKKNEQKYLSHVTDNYNLAIEISFLAHKISSNAFFLLVSLPFPFTRC